MIQALFGRSWGHMRKGNKDKSSWAFNKSLPLSVLTAGVSGERVKALEKTVWARF